MSLASISSVEDNPAVDQDLWMAIRKSAYGVGHREEDKLHSPWHTLADRSLYDRKEFQLISVSKNHTAHIRVLTTIHLIMEAEPYVTQVSRIIRNASQENTPYCLYYIVIFNANVDRNSKLPLGMEVNPGSW